MRGSNFQGSEGRNVGRNVGRHFPNPGAPNFRGRGRGRGGRGRGAPRGRGFHRMVRGNLPCKSVVSTDDDEIDRMLLGTPDNLGAADYDAAAAHTVPTGVGGPLPVDLRQMLQQWHSLFATQVGQVLNLRGVEKESDDG